MRVIKSPEKLKGISTNVKVFLAGTIEMGSSPDWQAEAIRLFQEEIDSQEEDSSSLDDTIILLNPRRDNWDSSWIQSIHNPEFKEQVSWELEGLEIAEYHLFYFHPDSISPIALMELGTMKDVESKENVVVVCHPDYYRKGNVDIFCERYDICMEDTLEEAVAYIVQSVNDNYL